jgi:hypothetical protein
VPKRKRDANEREIIRGLEAAGYECRQLESATDDETLDLLVIGPASMKLLEVKTKIGKVRDGQARITGRWPQHTAIVRTLDEALGAMGATVQTIPTLERHVAQTDGARHRRRPDWKALLLAEAAAN